MIRAEVIAEQSYRRYGRTRPRLRASYAGGALVIVAIVAGLAGLASTTIYTERTTVTGYLVPAGGITRIRAPRSGVIDDVRVAFGDRVELGEPLLRIVSESRIDSATTHTDALATNIDHRATVLATQHSIGERRLRVELARLDADRTGLDAELHVVEEQIEAQHRWIVVANERLTRFREASATGAVAAGDLLRLEGEVLTGEIQRKTLDRQRLALARERAQLTRRAEELVAEFDAQHSSLTLAELDLAAAALDNDRIHGEFLAAPVDGRIVSIGVARGQTIETGSELVVIAPEGGLRAELFVPTDAIGLIRVGQSLSIRYDAFPYTEFGVFAGKVREISEFVFDRRNIDVDLPLQGPVFRVIADPERQSLAAYGREVALKPGMTLVADIATRKLTVIEWLFEPLLALRHAPLER